MNISVPGEVRELIVKMNKSAPTIIYGGFLRDIYLGLIPNDIDIATKMTPAQIKDMFPDAHERTSVTGHILFGYKFEGEQKWYLEIYPTDEELDLKAYRADYTINALLFDGVSVIDKISAENDFESEIIRAVDLQLLQDDLQNKPQLWLKTIRLQAKTGYQFESQVELKLKEAAGVVNEIATVTKQAEGYKTLAGDHLLIAVESLRRLFIISEQTTIGHSTLIQTNAHGHYFKLCLLAVQIGAKLVDELCDWYQIPCEQQISYKLLLQAFESDERHKNSKIKNQVKELKKMIQNK
jgi:tRNA nucleotidyltransferase/poly(A) polymerase